MCFARTSAKYEKGKLYTNRKIHKNGSQNTKNEKCIVDYFASIFLNFAPRQGWHLRDKSKDFFSETQNLNEIRKVYSECFVFYGVYRKNTCEIPAKCEI